MQSLILTMLPERTQGQNCDVVSGNKE